MHLSAHKLLWAVQRAPSLTEVCVPNYIEQLIHVP